MLAQQSESLHASKRLSRSQVLHNDFSQTERARRRFLCRVFIAVKPIKPLVHPRKASTFLAIRVSIKTNRAHNILLNTILLSLELTTADVTCVRHFAIRNRSEVQYKIHPTTIKERILSLTNLCHFYKATNYLVCNRAKTYKSSCDRFGDITNF